MGTYNLPRNTKGEGRILYIFSTKALMYTFIGAVIGAGFYFVLDTMQMTFIGIIIVVICAFIGFSIATFKVPKIKSIQALKDVGGENIDDIARRFVKFKLKKSKIYTFYTKEEK